MRTNIGGMWWIRRYAPLELTGLGVAATAGVTTLVLTQNTAISALLAAYGETLGFYVAAFIAEFHRRPAHNRHTFAVIKSVVLEFGAAEAFDAFVVRPALMVLFERLTNNLVLGFVIGKVLSDIAFYGLAITSVKLRKVDARTTRISPTTQFRRATPYLSLDIGRVEASFDEFVEAFPTAHIYYAMKCNPETGILKALSQRGCNFEIASANELDQLIDIGVDPRNVLFSNPVKSHDDIARAAQAGVWRFAADSETELNKIASITSNASILLRLATTSSDQAGIASEGKFGVDETNVRRLACATAELGLNNYGIAFHAGSQTLDPFAWEPPIAASGRIMESLKHEGITLSAIDVGGGFPVAYEGTTPPALIEFGEIISKSFDIHLPYDVECFLEPGRALVANAGVMVATVIGTAERNGANWLQLDIGAFNGMMEALESANTLRFPIRDSRRSKRKSFWNVTGPSCDSQDTIRFGVPLSHDLSDGDRVYIYCAGAYTTSYASNFNGFEIPSVQARKTKKQRAA